MNISKLQEIYETFHGSQPVRYEKVRILKRLNEATTPPDPKKDSDLDKAIKKTAEEMGMGGSISPEKEQELIDKVGVKIVGGKMKLYQVSPELGRILAGLKINIVPANDQRIKTMAVDDYGNIYINPSFSDELSDNEFYGVFAHEAFHIASRSFLRKGSREHYLWNLATDAVMNWYLLKDGFELPKGGILPDVNTGIFKFPFNDPKTGKPIEITVFNPDGSVASAENVYEQLVKIRDSLPPQPPDQGEGEGEGEGEDEGEGGGKPDKPGKPGKPGKSGKGTGSKADDKVVVKPDGTVTVNGKPVKVDRSIFDKAVKDTASKTDTHLTKEEAQQVNKDVKELTPEEQAKIEKEIIDNLKKGKQEADQQRKSSRTYGSSGQIGGLRDFVKRLIPPDAVNWRGIIAAYLQHANSSVPTWMKPSRRGMAAGVPLPSRGSNPNKLHAIFAVDTSGSVGDEQLYVACNYIRKVADNAKNLDVRICLWASQAYYMSPNITDKGALESTLKNIKKFVKSGGNAISDVDRLIKQYKLNPVVTIYITDGQEEESSAAKLAQAGKYKKLFIIVNSFLDEAMIENINNLFARFGRIVFTPNLD